MPRHKPLQPNVTPHGEKMGTKQWGLIYFSENKSVPIFQLGWLWVKNITLPRGHHDH
jgi:hypothetical protein